MIGLVLLLCAVCWCKHGKNKHADNFNNNRTSSIGAVFLKCAKRSSPFVIGNKAFCIDKCADGSAPIVVNNRPVCPIDECAAGLEAVIDEASNLIVACLKPCPSGSFRSKFNNGRCIKFCADGAAPPFDDVKLKFLRCPVSCVGKMEITDKNGVVVSCVDVKPCATSESTNFFVACVREWFTALFGDRSIRRGATNVGRQVRCDSLQSEEQHVPAVGNRARGLDKDHLRDAVCKRAETHG
jgi:hypothetical protein